MIRALVIAAIALSSARALAYPQYQLTRDVTCTGCHLSPAGGTLLNENGLVTAEQFSQWGTNPAFLNGLLPEPKWLELGGDLRWAAGWHRYYDQNGKTGAFVTFPMQADLYGAATKDAFSVHVMAGVRDPTYPETYGPSLFASREHWLQWQQHPGETDGLYVRVGRFMPVYGLRLVEHPTYTRQYGGTPLYGETYGAAVEQITADYEVHVTAFAHDPLQKTTEVGNGVAAYGELRLSSNMAVGAETKLDITNDDRKLYSGVTGKLYLEPQKLLFMTELEFMHQKVDLGGTTNNFIGYAGATYFLGAVMIDLGLDLYAPSIPIRYLDQEAADLNIHWFVTSHVELLSTSRFQALEFGLGGQSSGYSLLQFHYRI
jgi:hypothetical protein